MEHFDWIADERHALATLLSGLTPAQLATPSLCGAWTVQQVFGHLTVPLTVGLPQFALAMLAARGNFDRANDVLARKAAAAGPTALATVLLASRQSGDTLLWIGAIVVAGVINTVCLLTSRWFARIFGKAGMEAMERLMGLILITMAVQMLISGIRVAFEIGS